MHEIWDSLICPLLANADMPPGFSSVANDPKRPFERLGGVGRSPGQRSPRCLNSRYPGNASIPQASSEIWPRRWPEWIAQR